MRNKLIFSLAGVAFSFAASGLAFAADIATKAPPPAPPPVYNWTGWYVGVNAGASFGNAKTDFNAPTTVAAITSLSGGQGTATLGLAGSNREYPDGFMGGGQIGYNWQYSPLIVVGLEADFQGALEKDSNTLTGNFPFVTIRNSVQPIAAVSDGSSVLNYQTKIEWFGTVRGRIGYVWGDGNVMSYLTGGLAYGKVDLEGTSTASGTASLAIQPPPPLPFSFTQTIGHSHVNAGWVVGYGTEGKLATPGWTWKVEGLWMDLGTLDATGSGASLSASSGGDSVTVTAGPVTTHTHFTDGVLRGGLNYKFY
jgi:outer membrane immunogenic protein